MPRYRFTPFALVAILPVVCVLSVLVYGFVKIRIPPVNSAPPQLASLSHTSSIRTARNNLTLNLSDGREVMSAFDGPPELRAALEHNQAHPLSLAAADFDEDGVPDLITGYEILDRGAFSFMRGNVDSIYPNEPAAKQRLASGRFTHAPFLSPALLFDSPAPVEFVGAGDFDGDSHSDIVVASHSRDSLFLFSGDGKGSFGPAKETKLPGIATAFVVGEINRSDGLADIVVGVNGPDGPAVLVFEGPEGALRASPERIRLAHSASALALAPLTDSYEIDLAIAAGNELQMVRGRDRKLSLDQQQQAEVPPLETRSRFFSQTIKAMSAGVFSASGNSDLALLFNDGELQLLINPGTVTESKSSRTTQHITRWKSLPSIKHWPGATSLTRVRISGKQGDDLAITDGYTKELEIWNAAENGNTSGMQPSEDVVPNVLPQEHTGVSLTALPMRLNADALSDLVVVSSDKSTMTVATSALMTDASTEPWTTTGNLTTARYRHTVTVLSKGEVLVAGGSNESGAIAAAELYDPSTGTWSTTSSLATPREGATATRLLNGKVLVVGGTNNFTPIATAELYNPSAKSWSSAGSLANGRGRHTATLLTNGKVLIAGGFGNSVSSGAELYDPSTNSWSAAGNLATRRGDSVAILLQNGKVLISGGNNNGPLASSEIYDPSTNTWTSAGNLNVARAEHTGVLLPNGKVLVVGGNGAAFSSTSAELYDPSTNAWSTAASLSSGRQHHSMTLLDNGKVLIAGGFGGATFDYLRSTETYDPVTDAWSNGGNMNVARGYHAAVLLQNGKILVCGGYNSNYLASGELYDPAVPAPLPQSKTFVVNSAADTDDGVCDVANCTLREAINASNVNLGLDTITFSIGTGAQTISPLSPLPSITETATLDATTQPGYSGSPIIQLNGELAGPANGLSIRAPNCVVRGFVINRFTQGGFLDGAGIHIKATGNAVIEGNYIGTDLNGSTAMGNSIGVMMLGPSISNTVGGTVVAARNVISGNGAGILMRVGTGRNDQSVIAGNYIGTDATGNVALGNGSGVALADGFTLTTIGGSTFGSRNIISGNQRDNINLHAVELSISGVLIQGNFIGTDVTGSVSLGGMQGVFLDGTQTFRTMSATIGGTTAGARNIVSGNSNTAIHLFFEEARAQIQGNYIGTDVSGSRALSNGSGVAFVSDATGTIGGSVSGARNVISGNIGSAIGIGSQFGQSNVVQGNFIGTDFTGTKKLGNGGGGIGVGIRTVGPSSIKILDNVVSNNGGSGVSIQADCFSFCDQPTGSLISNNQIGTDVTGQIDMGNGLDGVNFLARASANTVTGNTIAFNHRDGIQLLARSSSNTITGNTIAFNQGNGVDIPGTGPDAAVNNLIDSSIFANGELGINLGDPGVTPNDFQDPDVGGNTLQNFPVFTSVSTAPATSNARVTSKRDDNFATAASIITVNGTLNSTPNSRFFIQWTFTGETQCVNNQPQTRSLLAGKVPDVLTNTNGDASYSFDFDFPLGINAGLIYATATNSTNNTSEYSSCFPIRAAVPVTIQTNPAGRSFSVDGGSVVSSTQVLNWIPGSTHTIGTTSTQPGASGQQFVWNNWNDSGALSHTVTAPNSATTYTADFTTQYLLTMNAGSGGSTSPPNGFFNSGQVVQISAVPNNGFSFTGWTGSGSGSFSGNTNPISVTMNGPITQTAAFTLSEIQTPVGQHVSVTLNGVSVTFASVTRAGTTRIAPIDPNMAGQLPNSYQLTAQNTAFDISTTAEAQSPLTVCFNLTDATLLSQLRIVHRENGSLIDRTASQNFATKMICASVSSLSPFVLAQTNVPMWQLLLEEIGAPHHGAALDADLFIRDPFPIISSPDLLNAGLDRNTRVLVFVRNLQLTANETAGAVTVNLVDSDNQTYDIAAENLSVLPNVDFSQIRFRVPDKLAPGACTIQIRARGQVSNSGFIQIRP